MKIVVVYGSARKNGSSSKMVNRILKKIQTKNDNVIKYKLTKMNIKACIGCFSCRKNKNCIIKNDDMVPLFKDIVESDLVIFSSPLYCYDVSGSFKMMFDRLYPMLGGEKGFYKHRYPNKKCVMVYSQGAPLPIFRNATKIMKNRLKTNGFDIISFINIGLTGTTSKDNYATYMYLRLQNKKNYKKIENICNHLGR